MEMLLYQSTQFRDVKKILDRAHGFAGLLTAGGIEASRLDVPFVCDQKVLSRYDDVLAALTNWRTYSSSRGNLIDEFPGRAGSTLGSSDPPRHDRLRALIQSLIAFNSASRVSLALAKRTASSSDIQPAALPSPRAQASAASHAARCASPAHRWR